MALDCFNGLIHLPGCSTSTTGHSLHTRGITKKFVANIINEEETPEILLANVEKAARLAIQTDVLGHFSSKLKAISFIDRKSFGTPSEDQEELTVPAGRGGFVIEIDRPKSNVMVRIGSLGGWFGTTGDVAITVHDLADGSLVTTHTIAFTNGEILDEHVQIELPAHQRRKAYFVSTTQTDPFKVEMDGGDCGSCTEKGWASGGFRVWAARLEDGLPIKTANLRAASHTSGLTMAISAECDHSAMLCLRRNAFALPYVYKVEEMILERGVSAYERLNNIRVNKDDVEKRKDMARGEYEASMDKLLKNMVVPADPLCFACNSPTRTVTGIP